MISALGLRYFGEVARSGSFRAAAARLFVAASAISRQIALLEEDLGAPLFERGRGRTPLRLTAAGEILLKFVRETDQELDRVRSDIEALRGVRKGHIRFGMPESFTRDLMPDFLVRFSRRHPGITLHVEAHGSPRLVEMVSRDELDASITFNPPVALNVRHVFERQLVTWLLVAHDHPLYERPYVRLSDLADYGLAMPDASISAKQSYDDMFARARMRPRTVLSSNSYELLRVAAKAGLALMLANARPGEPLAVAGQYRYIPIRDPRVKPQRMTLCIYDGRNSSQAAAVFIEQLKHELSALDDA